MKKHIKILSIIVGILLIIGVSISFAYFLTWVIQEGDGATTTVSTTNLEDTTITVDGNIEFNDSNIYPGHQNVSSIKITATGDKNVLYNLVWEGTNTFIVPLRYTVYKTESEENPSISCEKKEEAKILEDRLGTIYYETCNENNFDNLGEAVSTGFITTSTENTQFKLLRNEEIQATNEGEVVYYYIVLEYINMSDGNQNVDMNGSFNGKVNISLLAEEDTCGNACMQILSNSTVNEGTPDFSETATTDGGVYATTDNLGTSYYFRGAVENNYVQFAGYYWRIVRINGNGSIRLIYDGTSLHENGESSSDRQIGTTLFNDLEDSNEYVGYMYNLGEVHGLESSSKIKQELDLWYQTHLLNYNDYMDSDTGFCGDRTPSTDYLSSNGLGGIGQTTTYYGSVLRLAINMNPSIECNNAEDLYTTSNSKTGNQVLTYPIGLITADEIAMAGGTIAVSNRDYYLYTGQNYWTMSPGMYDSTNNNPFSSQFAIVVTVSQSGQGNGYAVTGNYGIRPVINLSADVSLAGDGTISNPYQVGM